VRTFLYRSHAGDNTQIEADYVMFEPGFVVFCKGPMHTVPFIVLAERADRISWITEVRSDGQ
jgi:hypothetical protein